MYIRGCVLELRDPTFRDTQPIEICLFFSRSKYYDLVGEVKTMVVNARVWLQLAEAFGPVNRWYCSQAYGQPISDEDLLLVYFVKSGGAADFAQRFDQAMGAENRWYCSEYYGREIRDPMVLWNYYMSNHPARLSVAC
jgi:hypothetical protein